VGEMPPGEGPTGERRPKELAVVMPAGCIDIDMLEMYELDREVDTEGIVAPRGRLVKRPWGDPRRGIPRRCSSLGLAALLFCPPGT
jgi:hypothetical protein